MITDAELNERIRALDGQEFDWQVRGLEGTGKVIPYLGWHWRDVDFYHHWGLWMGYAPAENEHPALSGFMENNKWDYFTWKVSDAERAKIREMLEAVAEGPTPEKCQALYDYIQGLTPERAREWMPYSAENYA